jgi:hypothetical protein
MLPLRDTRPSGAEPTGSLSLDEALREEYEHLHGAPAGNKGQGLGGLYEAIHGLTEKRAALCLSGGGIRSATFALGVMQGPSPAAATSGAG